MQKLIQRLQTDFGQFIFKAGNIFHWSPAKQQITYTVGSTTQEIFSLFHELGHALLQHASYANDAELLQKELAAWIKARSVAQQYNIAIDPDYVEYCLDSYRDWIYKRSRCPQCSSQGIQIAADRFNCPNCNKTWLVNNDRLCRPYRRIAEN